MTVSNQSGNMRKRYNRVRNQRGLATWVKVLIGVMIIGTIGFIVLIAGGVYFVGGAMKQMNDPAQVRSTVDSIAKFSDPLPTGWKFGIALNMFGTSIAVVNNDKESLMVTLLKLPRSDKDIDPTSVIESYAEKGVPSVGGTEAGKTSAKLNIQQRGELTVAGEKMSYVTGYSERGSSRFSQMIGCVMPKATKEAIIVQGVTLNSEEYKIEQTKTLLGSIKGF